VIVNIETDFPDRFFDADGFLLRAPGSEDEPRFMPVVRVRPHKERIVIQFRGVDSRNAAEELRNMELVIPIEDRATEEDYFHHFELEGMTVATTDGRPLGTVAEIMVAPGHDVLVVRREGHEILVPFTRSICLSVDRETRRIVVDLPDGLETVND